MKMIVMVDSKWGISRKGKPIASIPAEKKSRVQEVAGAVVVYDLDTMDELPGQQPIKGAVNILFTDGQKKEVRGAKCFQTVAEVREELTKYDTDEVYIIGSETLYREFLPDTDMVHVTKIDYTYEADAFFENLDINPDFYITADSDEQYCFDIVYSFLRYERRKKN